MRSELDRWSWNLYWDIDGIKSFEPVLFMGSSVFILINQLSVFDWPKVVTLRSAAFHRIASCHNQCDILLRDHAPQVLKGVIEWALRSYYLSIRCSAHRSINKVCINVTRNKGIFLDNIRTRYKVNPGVPEGEYVWISIQVSDLFVVDKDFSLVSSLCALFKSNILALSTWLILTPSWHVHRYFVVNSRMLFYTLPYIMW